MRIVGRQKDIINRGGLKISAREIEEFLLQHPLVREATVVAVPDERLGEKRCAFVIPREDRAPRLGELLGFLEERGIAKFKLPEFLVVLPQFPMTPIGNIQKFLLRDGAASGTYFMHTA